MYRFGYLLVPVLVRLRPLLIACNSAVDLVNGAHYQSGTEWLIYSGKMCPIRLHSLCEHAQLLPSRSTRYCGGDLAPAQRFCQTTSQTLPTRTSGMANHWQFIGLATFPGMAHPFRLDG